MRPILEARPTRARALDRKTRGLVDDQRFAVLEQDGDGVHANAAAIRRSASSSTAWSAAKLIRKPASPPNALAATTATPWSSKRRHNALSELNRDISGAASTRQ